MEEFILKFLFPPPNGSLFQKISTFCNFLMSLISPGKAHLLLEVAQWRMIKGGESPSLCSSKGKFCEMPFYCDLDDNIIGKRERKRRGALKVSESRESPLCATAGWQTNKQSHATALCPAALIWWSIKQRLLPRRGWSALVYPILHPSDDDTHCTLWTSGCSIQQRCCNQAARCMATQHTVASDQPVIRITPICDQAFELGFIWCIGAVWKKLKQTFLVCTMRILLSYCFFSEFWFLWWVFGLWKIA